MVIPTSMTENEQKYPFRNGRKELEMTFLVHAKTPTSETWTKSIFPKRTNESENLRLCEREISFPDLPST
jgi:hypothetical protein